MLNYQELLPHFYTGIYYSIDETSMDESPRMLIKLRYPMEDGSLKQGCRYQSKNQSRTLFLKETDFKHVIIFLAPMTVVRPQPITETSLMESVAGFITEVQSFHQQVRLGPNLPCDLQSIFCWKWIFKSYFKLLDASFKSFPSLLGGLITVRWCSYESSH